MVDHSVRSVAGGRKHQSPRTVVEQLHVGSGIRRALLFRPVWTFDGLIAAGQDGASSSNPPSLESHLEDASGSTGIFCREGETWSIEFNGEKCRLATIIGLEYISVLLRYAGTRIGAEAIRAERALAVPKGAKDVIRLSRDSVLGESYDSSASEIFDRPDSSQQDVLGSTTRAQAISAIEDTGERRTAKRSSVSSPQSSGSPTRATVSQTHSGHLLVLGRAWQPLPTVSRRERPVLP